MPLDAIAADAKRLELRLARVDIEGRESKTELMRAFATALDFPDYFGANWDALEECLIDMPAEDGRGLALLISGIDHFAATQHDDFRTLVHVLNATADAWWERQRRFYALFIDKGPLAGADIWLPVIRKPADMQPAHG